MKRVELVDLTCNRLMVLLALYRGTLDDEMPIGTRSGDLAYLIGEGLVEVVSEPEGEWRLTPVGDAVVQHLLFVAAANIKISPTAAKPKGEQS